MQLKIVSSFPSIFTTIKNLVSILIATTYHTLRACTSLSVLKQCNFNFPYLVTHWKPTGSPLEAGDDAVLDLVKVLHSLGAVNHQVGSVGVGIEAPDLPAMQWSEKHSKRVLQFTKISLESHRASLQQLSGLGHCSPKSSRLQGGRASASLPTDVTRHGHRTSPPLTSPWRADSLWE